VVLRGVLAGAHEAHIDMEKTPGSDLEFAVMLTPRKIAKSMREADSLKAASKGSFAKNLKENLNKNLNENPNENPNKNLNENLENRKLETWCTFWATKNDRHMTSLIKAT
jgi:hypothetical protein